jgi:hypothetical protein
MVAERLHGPWRVELHVHEQVEVITRIESGFAHHSALEPVIARLCLEGRREGLLLLIDEATGVVAARRRIDRLRRRTSAYRRPDRLPVRMGDTPPAAV